MCGAFNLSYLRDDMAGHFDFMKVGDMLTDLEPFHFYPGSQVPTITKNSPARMELMRWGLIAPWISDPKDQKFPTHNCRVEGFTEKPTFAHAWKNMQRCIMPANDFIEWKRTYSEDHKKIITKKPYIIRIKGESVFSFAGLYEVRGDQKSVTMFTTESTSRFAKIHNRVPVILTREQEEAWIDKETPIDVALSFLVAPDDSRLEIAEQE